MPKSKGLKVDDKGCQIQGSSNHHQGNSRGVMMNIKDITPIIESSPEGDSVLGHVGVVGRGGGSGGGAGRRMYVVANG
jgi:hypothetical protein